VDRQSRLGPWEWLFLVGFALLCIALARTILDGSYVRILDPDTRAFFFTSADRLGLGVDAFLALLAFVSATALVLAWVLVVRPGHSAAPGPYFVGVFIIGFALWLILSVALTGEMPRVYWIP
jgi:hypothetical protein